MGRLQRLLVAGGARAGRDTGFVQTAEHVAGVRAWEADVDVVRQASLPAAVAARVREAGEDAV